MGKQLWKWILGLAVGMAAAGCGAGNTGNSRRLIIGTSEHTGSYYAVGTDLAQILQEELPDYAVSARETNGSSDNVRLLSDNTLQLALAQTDILYDARNGIGMFNDTFPVKGFSAVAALYPEALHIVVRRDAAIESLRDLIGCRIGTGSPDSGTEQNAFEVFAACGIEPGSITTVNMTTAEAGQALKDGTIDAFFVTSSIGNTVIAALNEELPVRMLGLSEELSEKMCSKYNYFFPYEIPADSYEGQTEPIRTIAVESCLICRDSLPDDLVKTITSVLFSHADELSAAMPNRFKLSEQDAVRDVPLPFHPGAVQYYEEAGVRIGE